MVGNHATIDSCITRFRCLTSEAAFAAARALIVLCLFATPLAGQTSDESQSAIRLGQSGVNKPQEPVPEKKAQRLGMPSDPVLDTSDLPLQVSGNMVQRWRSGQTDYSYVQGDCVIVFGTQHASADRVLLVIDGPPDRIRTRMVVAGMVTNNQQPSPISTFVSFRTSLPKITAPIFRGEPSSLPDLFEHLPGEQTTDAIQSVQFNQPINDAVSSDPPSNSGSSFAIAGGTKNLELLPRNPSILPQIQQVDRPEANESLIVARGGVTVLIRDLTAQVNGEIMDLGTVALSANRVVAWLPLLSKLFQGTADIRQAQGELYLEGDIVLRQGERIIYAESMYYNIATEQGMILNAEAITTIPEYQGIVRLKSEVMQQVSEGNFIAFDAAVTSSRMGVPRYWLQSERLQLTDRQRTVADPITGLTTIESEPFVQSNNNFVYFGGAPIAYWPTFSTSLERPAFYLAGAKIKNDNIFGTQVLLDWDLFQLLGIENAPRGVDWELTTDYLSDRGPAIGTSTRYDLPALFGIPGPVRGIYDSWLIDDDGFDNLGSDRRQLTPEESIRGRSLLRHRHYLPYDQELIAELGLVSDRNFLEQFLENEWDQDTDHRTGLRYRRYGRSHLFELSAQVRLNDFFTETERLPQLDHYVIGNSLLGDRITWTAHSKVGYNRLRVADDPVDPAEALEYSPLPGEVESKGVVAATRQEIAAPIQLGPVRVVPNVSGEVSHYGEAADGNDLTRLLGQAGVRASLPMWTVDPSIESSLLNVRGLAHKVEWTAEYFYADSDTNFDELPLYDPLDDNAQEQFRRRFIDDTFGGLPLPARFDPRTYALRHGYQRYVVSPSDVVADDLQQFRLGLHQRWQTKRGLPGRERIVDLFQFDLDTILFPDADRDNFGETVGPTTYDVRYHVGDRVSLLSDGYFDFFGDGLRSISAGVRSSRPGVGDIYLGVLSLEGPISSTVLRATTDYRLNEKWIVSGATTYDFGNTGNVGQSIALTRIGESMLIKLGVNVDEGRDNVGVGFAIEPRFWPRPRLGRIGGQLIPPPGVEGLE